MNARHTDNKALMRKIARMFETGDLSDVRSVIATDYVDYQDLDGVAVQGGDGFGRVVRAARRGLARLRVRIGDLIAEDDRVVARLRWDGIRQTGDRRGRETIDIVRFAGGRALEHWGGETADLGDHRRQCCAG